MFAHPLVPVALDCHCNVHVPVPPLGVAVNVTLPPTQTVDEDGVMLTEGSGVTVTEAVFDVAASQPPPVQLYVAR
ncbi:MAG: hypothetical protein KIPDCIKN_00205 [Haliscomenobacter sp.]|jgi:hypothetical protein|nr:hypothetical protein [Haliscomenobacter sp.]MBV6425721.1 hypothetical protein [Haliscomenobacter sp.]